MRLLFQTMDVYPIQITPYIVISGFLYLIFGMQIIRMRWKYKVGIESGDHDELRRWIRVFGNFSEYTPIVLILLFALEYVGASAWWLHTLGCLFIIGRFLHAYGLSRNMRSSPGRTFGVILTFTVILFSSFYLILSPLI